MCAGHRRPHPPSERSCGSVPSQYRSRRADAGPKSDNRATISALNAGTVRRAQLSVEIPLPPRMTRPGVRPCTAEPPQSPSGKSRDVGSFEAVLEPGMEDAPAGPAAGDSREPDTNTPEAAVWCNVALPPETAHEKT